MVFDTKLHSIISHLVAWTRCELWTLPEEWRKNHSRRRLYSITLHCVRSMASTMSVDHLHHHFAIAYRTGLPSALYNFHKKTHSVFRLSGISRSRSREREPYTDNDVSFFHSIFCCCCCLVMRCTCNPRASSGRCHRREQLQMPTQHPYT